MRNKELPRWIGGVLGLGALLLLAWLEGRRPLRRAVEPKLRRDSRNLTLAGLGAAAVLIAETPVVRLLTRVAAARWGLLNVFHLPVWMEIPAALLLMDYSMYLWHILTHRVPFLWRFHLVHHTDLDLDASTALRFHFGEQLASVPWRAGQVVLIGLSPLGFSLWQVLFLISILFHHSEVELPLKWERRLNRIVVTPRMHGIHHSIVRAETNSNWSSGLTLWDRLHGTLRLNIPQRDITIGVPAYRRPEEVTLPKIIRIPFVKLPSVWQLPGNGEPERSATLDPPRLLLP
jgi:sterol desaturase/sphingolipid hydroxylase (fatty acid hydroxylase superfamily)